MQINIQQEPEPKSNARTSFLYGGGWLAGATGPLRHADDFALSWIVPTGMATRAQIDPYQCCRRAAILSFPENP